MTPLIKAENLSLSFKNKDLLKGISLEIFSGELVKLSGPNGCGKTTLLESLIGLKKTSSVTRNFSQKDYGYLPQLSKIFPKMSLILRDVSNQEYPFYPPSLFARHWSFASGGEKMKSLIARAFDQGEKILFLDEPFNHLDQMSCLKLTKHIEKKVQEGMTIVYIGHQSFEINQREIEVSQWSC